MTVEVAEWQSHGFIMTIFVIAWSVSSNYWCSQILATAVLPRKHSAAKHWLSLQYIAIICYPTSILRAFQGYHLLSSFCYHLLSIIILRALQGYHLLSSQEHCCNIMMINKSNYPKSICCNILNIPKPMSWTWRSQLRPAARSIAWSWSRLQWDSRHLRGSLRFEQSCGESTSWDTKSYACDVGYWNIYIICVYMYWTYFVIYVNCI